MKRLLLIIILMNLMLFGMQFNTFGATVSKHSTFIDNGDGTVSDELTGLMWQQSDNGIKLNFNQASMYCDELDLAGYSDWHLPTKDELKSLVGSCRKGKPSQGGKPTTSPPMTARQTNFAFAMSILNGHGSKNYIHCVRPDIDVDIDADGISDAYDNCPTIYNPNQEDVNADGYGDACVDLTAIISPDAIIGSNPVVGANSSIGPGTIIGENAVIGSDVLIWRNSNIGNNLTIGNGSTIKQGLTIGSDVSIGEISMVIGNLGSGIYVGNDTTIGAYVTIGDGTTIGDSVHIWRHAAIGSDVLVGNSTGIGINSTIGNGTIIGESVDIRNDVVIENNVTIGDGALVKQLVIIGENADIGVCAVINEDVAPYDVVSEATCHM